jgi:enoyl-CoA hydratase/carnithine racemase
MGADSYHREDREGTAWLVLDRGPRNLLDAGMTRGLADEVAALAGDSTVTAVVLSGAGGVFCSGADGPQLRAMGTVRVFADALVDLFAGLALLPKPVIAAVDGDALAGGFGLACASDLVIASVGARLGTIEASLGTWPMIAQVPASRRVPPKALLRNVLTGIPFAADEALALGIVDEVVADGDAVRARAQELAATVGTGGAPMAGGRPLLLGMLGGAYRQDLERAADAFTALFEGAQP